MTKQQFHGWGRTNPSYVDVLAPTDENAVLEILQSHDAVVARGLGRSYGDAAQVSGGVVLDNRQLRGISSITNGSVTVGGGVSIDELLIEVMPQGWFVPVTPGTRQVTMGGAVAADVHGKGHHRDGSFANYVTAMRVATPDAIVPCSPTSESDLFWATVGGLGLTGVITEITLSLLAIDTDLVLVDVEHHGNLDDVMHTMVETDHLFRYSVAWIDCMARGKKLGRAVLERANLAHVDDDVGGALNPPRPPRLAVPFATPVNVLNPLSMRIFNEAVYRRPPRRSEREPRRLTTFFHPLDAIADWNQLYGKRGFVQYQFVVPDDHRDAVRDVVTALSSSGVGSFLAVLKRFGPGNAGLLSFPLAGWTLALDLPVGNRDLPTLLDTLDDLVARANGRVYLVKDSRLDPSHIPAMYPRLEEFQRVKARHDPTGVLTSDLARRLLLVRE